MDLEKRIETLEKRVAELEGRVQEQPKVVQIGISNVDEFKNLIEETIENLNRIQNFELRTNQIVK